MSSMSYCLLPLILLRRSSNAQSSSSLEHYTGLLINIHIFVIKFWVPRLSPPWLQPALLFCSVPQQPNTDTPASVDDSSAWHLTVMTGLAFVNREKGILSVNIMARSVTRLASVMHYMSVNIVASQVTRLTSVIYCMVVLLALLHLFRPTLPHLRLLGILLLLFHQIHLLCLTNFSNGIRINSFLVPLPLLLTEVHLLLVWLNLLLLVLGFLIQEPLIILLVTNLCSLLYPLLVLYLLLHWLMVLESHLMVLALLNFFLL